VKLNNNAHTIFLRLLVVILMFGIPRKTKGFASVAVCLRGSIVILGNSGVKPEKDVSLESKVVTERLW
jgi:hypothetical protein